MVFYFALVGEKNEVGHKVYEVCFFDESSLAFMGDPVNGAEYDGAIIFHPYHGGPGGFGLHDGRSNAHDVSFQPLRICPAPGIGPYFLDSIGDLAGTPHSSNRSRHPLWNMAGSGARLQHRLTGYGCAGCVALLHGRPQTDFHPPPGVTRMTLDPEKKYFMRDHSIPARKSYC